MRQMSPILGMFVNLDENEANVSNFRDVVSAALPFEAETGEVTNIKAPLC